MTLGGAGDVIGPVQTGVEPLRRVGRGHLMDQHVGEFVVERLRVFWRSEIAVGFAPVTPATCQPMNNLASRALRAENRLSVVIENGSAVVGDLGNTGFPEILRHHDVGCDLGPCRWHLGVLHLEHDRTILVRDLRGPP